MKALIFGASGLVGSNLLQKLLQSAEFSEVISFGRTILPVNDSKLKQKQIDFEQLEGYAADFDVDIVFCCLGTTLSKAGSKENFKKVDFDYPVQLGKLSEQNKVKKIVVISSMGANADTSNFYLKTKGEMEQQIGAMKIPIKIFVRPSLLLGARKEKRFGEKMGAIFLSIFEFLLIGKMKNYRSIRADVVAEAMILLAQKQTVSRVFLSDELNLIVKKSV